MNTGKVANKPTIFPIMQRANPAFLENLGLGDARATDKKSLGISGIHLYWHWWIEDTMLIVEMKSINV